MIGFVIRLILFALMILTGVLWAQAGVFLWWGLICIFLFIIFLASFGLDGSNIIWFID